MIAGRKPAPRLSNLHGGACFERCDARSRRRVMISEVLGPEHRRSTAGSGRCDRGHWRARAPFGILDGEGDAEFNVGGSESTGSWRWSVGRRFGEALVAAVGRVNVGGSESTGSWRWSVGRRFGEASVAAVGRVNVGGLVSTGSWRWSVGMSTPASLLFGVGCSVRVHRGVFACAADLVERGLRLDAALAARCPPHPLDRDWDTAHRSQSHRPPPPPAPAAGTPV